MKRAKRIGSILFLSCCMSFSVMYAETTIERKLRTDERLVAPGIGSCTAMIEDRVDSFMEKTGRDHVRVSKPAATAELFQNVFHVSIPIKIFFDSIYYFESKQCALCVNRGMVMAIIGFSNKVNTIDSVSLKSGINNFIFHYGNNDLIRMERGGHELFAYPKLGIALVDDSKNDSIDRFVVFSPKDR